MEITKLSNAHFFGVTTPECGRPYVLTPDQDLIVDIIYWARNRRLGMKKAQELDFHVGPSGRLVKNPYGKAQFWWPAPYEGCDCEDLSKCPQNVIGDDGTYKATYDPWLWWKHCKSRQHITFLVVHRMHGIVNNRFFNYWLPILMNIVRKGVPLYINERNEIIAAFVRDALSGINWDTEKYFKTEEDLCQKQS